MATIQTPMCSTCMERWPGMKISAHSSECQRCCRDKGVPKMYATANNINPGSLPQELCIWYLNLMIRASHVRLPAAHYLNTKVLPKAMGFRNVLSSLKYILMSPQILLGRGAGHDDYHGAPPPKEANKSFEISSLTRYYRRSTLEFFIVI